MIVPFARDMPRVKNGIVPESVWTGRIASRFVMQLAVLGFFASTLMAQRYEVINQENPEVSYRGLAFITNSGFVVSGSRNTIGRSTDGGRTFQWIQAAAYTGRDFRDIEVLGDLHYAAVAVDRPGLIIETRDGGATWQEVFYKDTAGIFLNALFKTVSGDLYAVGDPVSEGRPYVLKNNREITALFNHPLRRLHPGEAFFAASGSNLYVDDSLALLVSGGKASVLYSYSHQGVQAYPLEKGAGETAGINGMYYDPVRNKGLLLGGDFNEPGLQKGNFFRFSVRQGALVFHPSRTVPTGYKTDAVMVDDQTLIVCGYSGVEISRDGGDSWQIITRDSYNTCAISPDGKTVLLAGSAGKIGKISL